MPKKCSRIGPARPGNTMASQLTLLEHVLKRQWHWGPRGGHAGRLQVEKNTNVCVPDSDRKTELNRAGQGAVAGR